ncbi:hypothetical protein DFP73DRAFT_109280 [Morchella snyderi]|nr:hypothetical protein DFP73DRAFT_109280 [Morchella snyderi]
MPPHRRRTFTTMRTPPPLRRSDWWNHPDQPHHPRPPSPMPSPSHPTFQPTLPPTAPTTTATTAEMTDAAGTSAPWWPTWPPQHTHTHMHMHMYTAADPVSDGDAPPAAAALATFLRERDEAVDHLLSFAASAAAPDHEGTTAAATTTGVTLLGTARLLEALAGELVVSGGGSGRAAWAGVDAALTALVVLGCGGARVGAVGVGACVLCYARVADCVVRPCGHLVLCEGCVLAEGVGGGGGGGAGAGKRKQVVCPVPECGMAVEETVRTYRG